MPGAPSRRCGRYLPTGGAVVAVAAFPFQVRRSTRDSSGLEAQLRRRVAAPEGQPPLPLNIVLQGNSILGGGGGVTTPFKPVTLIAAARPTATVTDAAPGGGGDIVNLRTNIANVTSLYNPARRNVAILLETSNYINDTRGEAAFGGDGLSLSDPSAAGLAYYNLVLAWVADVRAAGFLACVCTASIAYENTASPLSNNTQYLAAQNAAHTNMRSNTQQFDYFADPANDSRMQDTADTTYFDGSRIHLTDPGSQVLSDIIIAALPS